MLDFIVEISVILIFSTIMRFLFGVSYKRSMLDDSYNHLFYIKTQQNRRYLNFTFFGL